MNVKKTDLAALDQVYSISLIDVEGQRYCMAASEAEGGSCLLIHTVTGKVYPVWRQPGGTMTLLPVKGEEGTFLSIDRFYPVFRSEEAEITHNTLHLENGELACSRTRLARLPFVHRISLIQTADGPFLAGGTLCAGKDFVEDWSKPGGVWVGRYRGCQPLELVEIHTGLVKNHGMFVQQTLEGDQLYVCADQGVIRLRYESSGWLSDTLTQDPASDVWLYDVDGDGAEEMLTIQPFHGDIITVYRRQGDAWRAGETLPLTFGHVLWAGSFAGDPCIIGGSRGADKELTAYLVKKSAGGPVFEPRTLDTGVGPTQIAVEETREGLIIYGANHGAGTVAKYELTSR